MKTFLRINISLFLVIISFILISNRVSKKMHDYPESIKSISIIDKIVDISEGEDSTINDLHRDQEIVVMLTSPGCKPCIQQMDTLNKLALESGKIEYIVVSSHPIEEKQKKYANLKFSYYKKYNKNPVFKYLQSLKFNKQNVTPVTILIKDNRIEDYLIGFDERTMEVIDAFHASE